MSVLAILNHLINLSAPALAVAVLLPFLARLFTPGSLPSLGLVRQAAVNFTAGLAVSLAGLWHFGQDGKMATYCALVLAAASSQWVMQRARQG